MTGKGESPPAEAGAAGGALWGSLIGLLFLAPLLGGTRAREAADGAREPVSAGGARGRAMSALVGSWSAIVLRGVVAIVFGVFALLLPGLTVGVVIAIFAVFTIVYGLIALVSAILARGNDQPWLGELLTGAAAIAAAVVVMIWPDLTAAGLLVVIAIFAVVVGIAELAVAAGLQRLVHRTWPLALAGVLSIAFGVALFAASSEGAVALAWLVGVYAVLFGASLVGLGLVLRGLNQT